jgi:WD40 repeat protein
MTQNGNCFVATGSRDSTIMIWIWNGTKGLIVNKDLSTANNDENPSPGAILTGHIKQIVGVVISSELGLVISASQQGPVLVHTVYGDLLRQFEPNSADVLEDPTQLYMLQDAENVCVIYKSNYVAFFTINGKQLNQIKVEDESILVC